MVRLPPREPVTLTDADGHTLRLVTDGIEIDGELFPWVSLVSVTTHRYAGDIRAVHINIDFVERKFVDIVEHPINIARFCMRAEVGIGEATHGSKEDRYKRRDP